MSNARRQQTLQKKCVIILACH